MILILIFATLALSSDIDFSFKFYQIMFLDKNILLVNNEVWVICGQWLFSKREFFSFVFNI